MNQIIIKYYKSKYGELVIGSFKDKLCLCDWAYRKQRNSIDTRIKRYLNAEFINGESLIISETIRQLEEYFNYKRKEFSLPYVLIGTDFQKEVWNSLLSIPFGKSSNYLTQAEKLGRKSGVRAVASANGANALAIIVPCHRVIGSDGSLTGYAGGLSVKKKLLELEQDMFIEV